MNRSYRDYCRRHGAELLQRKPPDFAPTLSGEELAEVRAGNLYGLDRISNLRFSHENPSIQKIYREYFQQPMSEKAHHLLHTDHEAWEMPQAPALELDPSDYM